MPREQVGTCFGNQSEQVGTSEWCADRHTSSDTWHWTHAGSLAILVFVDDVGIRMRD